MWPIMNDLDRPNAATCPFGGTSLKLLPNAIGARCMICGERGLTRTWCTQGHFVCEDCRGNELWALVEGLLGQEYSSDPVEIFVRMRESHDFPMHGPEHHPLVAAAFLIAYRSLCGEPAWPAILDALRTAATQLPGGTCGFWGACSAGLAVGMAYSTALDSSPTAGEPRAAAHRAVARILERISQFTGPRCCRRECLLALQVACELSSELLPHPVATTYRGACAQAADNPECLGSSCPYA
jgi:7,8-dihydro-6-hydroxymethylpterin dimethyltransferase